MNIKDYYKILNINKSADEQTIKRAYKKLALKYHPDHNPGDKIALEKFKEIKEAYEILIDPQKRDQYDNSDGVYQFYDSTNTYNFYYDNPGFNSDFFGDFSDFFYSSPPQHKRYTTGEVIQHNVELSLKESVLGITKNINLFILNTCDPCAGTGSIDKKNHTCSQCQGTGYLKLEKIFFNIKQNCNLCHGEGVLIKNKCSFCQGEGRIRVNKNFKVNFPAGVNNNNHIKLEGQGNIGRRGVVRGDIFIYVKIKKHFFFKRTNNDLSCEIPITFITSTLGGEIEIPTFENNIKLKIPKQTQTNQIFRFRGLGVPDLTNPLRKGDILCKLIVETPINLTKKQLCLFLQLQVYLCLIIMNNFPLLKKFLEYINKFKF